MGSSDASAAAPPAVASSAASTAATSAKPTRITSDEYNALIPKTAPASVYGKTYSYNTAGFGPIQKKLTAASGKWGRNYEIDETKYNTVYI